MSSPADMAERQTRCLARLAELGMALAEQLAAQAQAAKTEAEAQGFALAFHRVSRAVRLTLALEVRLDRERREALREQGVDERRAAEHRKHQVRAVIGRSSPYESETDEAERLLDDLDELIDQEALFEAFLQAPLQACIARIRKDLGLPPLDPANDADTGEADMGEAQAPLARFGPS